MKTDLKKMLDDKYNRAYKVEIATSLGDDRFDEKEFSLFYPDGSIENFSPLSHFETDGEELEIYGNFYEKILEGNLDKI